MRPILVLALTSVVALAGCNTIPLRTAPAAVAGCDLALASGQLVNSRQSGLALRGTSGEVIPVVWPFGYTSRGFVGGMELIDESGAVLAREGDFIEVGGGLDRDGFFGACAGSVTVVPPPG